MSVQGGLPPSVHVSQVGSETGPEGFVIPTSERSEPRGTCCFADAVEKQIPRFARNDKTCV